jgi:hypothetical protein
MLGATDTLPQFTTDGHKAYLSAVEDAFGADIDYAILVKIYGAAPEGSEIRYSPRRVHGNAQRSYHWQTGFQTRFNQFR